MECEFPCEEALFQSEHPFADPKFRFSRNLTIYEGFRNLFLTSPPVSPHETPETTRMDLTVLDMFILIHSTYCISIYCG